MSSTYRDDTQDTAVVANSVWGGLSQLVEEAATLAETLVFSLLVMHAGTAVAADVVSDSTLQMSAETVQIADAVLDTVSATQTVKDTAKAADKAIPVLRVVHAETARVGDAASGLLQALSADTARLQETWITEKTATVLVVESARLGDSAAQYASTEVDELATASDAASGRNQTGQVVAETARVGDESFGQHQAAAIVVVGTAKIAAEVSDRLRAANIVHECAVLEDYAPGGEGSGQAWTANNDTWAMSRYAPYTFVQLVVIDGRVFGMAADGVYALDGEDSQVEGKIATGRMNMGEREAIPVQAFITYAMEAAGTASMAVTSFQSGSAETYSYALTRGGGAALRSGRFEFGRGLRGRMFEFALSLSAKTAFIDDLRIDSAQSKRRI